MVKANCNASPAAGHVASNGTTGKIRKSHGPEYAEMQLYLSKLKELVPHVPKNKKVSKLEVIQHVIDYICDLQWALESHPAMRGASSAVHLPMMESADSEDLDDEGRQLQQQLAAAAAAATAVCLHSHSETAISNSSSSNPHTHTHTRTPLGVLPPTQNLTAVPSSPMPRSETKA